MNKIIKNTLLYMILAIVLLIPCVIALDTSKLLYYYSFEDNVSTTIIDSNNKLNLTYPTVNPLYPIYENTLTGLTKVNGINGYGYQWGSGQTVFIGNSTNFFNQDYSINFWFNNQGIGGGDDIILALYNSSAYNTKFRSRTSPRIEFLDYTRIVTLNQPYNNTILSANITPNAWNMVTLTFSTPNNFTKLYINGVLIVSTYGNIHPLYPNTNKILVGMLSQFEIIDELSFWNYTIDGSDINLLLYNNGFGKSYTSTLSTENVTFENKCIDEHTYCSSSGVGINDYGVYYCTDSLLTSYCDSCVNDICTQDTPQECSTIGSKFCEDSTSYSTCDDSDSDGYLDLKTITSCTLGTYCVQSFNLALCKNVTNNETSHLLYGIKVTPYSVSSNVTFYLLDAENRNLNVKSTYSVHTQQFYVAGSSDMNFITRTCNYKETSLQEMNTETIINETNTFILSSPVGDESIMRLSFEPNSFDNGTIEILSQTSSVISSLKYYRNATLKKFCITKLDNTELLCDYDYESSDTLKNVFLEYTFDMTSATYTVKVITNRSFEQVNVLSPQTMFGTDVASISINSVESTLYYFNIVKIPRFNNYNTIVSNGLTNAPCIFTSAGTYLVRTYGNNNGMPDYSSYVDYTITIGNLGLTKNELAQANGTDTFISNLSITARYVLMIIICVVIILLFTLFMSFFGDALSGLLVGLVLSIITSLALTIVFKLSLLLPILYIIFGGALVALLVRKVFAG